VSDNLGRDLGQHIHQLRVSRGLSVRALAAQAKVDFSWLSKLERGEYEQPGARHLYQLARALDIEVQELYLIAGYEDAGGLPGFEPYLRAKYDLPDEAIQQLQAHFDLINEKYQPKEGGHHGYHQPPQRSA
jgi:transcriptional regulator with XRE-family HTH domain